MFQMVLALTLSGAQFSLLNTVGSFCWVVFGGALLGSLIGYVASRITSAFDDHLLEITLTMVTAYGSYLLADYLHVSSIIAVVGAGIVVGNYGSRTGMSVTTRLAVNSFWEYAAFLVNSLLFLLIGLQVQLPLLLKHANLIGLGVLAVFAARLLVVYGICPFVSSERLPIPDKWRHLMFWGGLRGALVMALALSLPLSFPDRESIINMTFGVVLFTLLVPGLTMEPLVRVLGMAPKQEKYDKYQEYKATLMALKAELQAATKLKDEHKMSISAYNSWKAVLDQDAADASKNMENLQLSDSTIDALHDRQAQIRLLEDRKEFFSGLVKEGMLAEHSAHRLCAKIDVELEQLLDNHKVNPPTMNSQTQTIDDSSTG
jgi:CPA1 family monovalent cation:H+ antiporter